MHRFVAPMLVVLLVAGTALVAPRARAQQAGDPWSEATRMPTARSEMPAVATGGIVYVPGGLASDRTLAVVEAYDPSAGTWRTLPPLPVALHHTSVAALDGRVFVAGGYTSLAFDTASDGIWAYAPGADAWRPLPAMPAPRAAHALVALDGRLHVVGGVGPRADRVWTFDPSTNTWSETSAPLPTPREHLAAAVVDGRLYAIGGRAGGANLGTVEVYDPSSGAWASLPELPTPRSGLTAGVLDGRIHVLGGETLGDGRTFDAHEVFDPAAASWSPGPPLPTSRHGLASAVVDGRLYVVGGATRAGAETFGSLTDVVEMFVPGAGAE